MKSTLLAMLLAALPASAATFNVGPTQSLATIQATANSMAIGDTLQFAAGSYSWPATLAVKCGTTLQGPIATPATAVITETKTGATALAYGGPCTAGAISVTYLGFLQGGIYFANANFTNVAITHNQFGALQSTLGGTSIGSAAIYMDGSLSNTTTNITVEYNTFGDANSCTAVFAVTADEGGYCVGFFHQAGTAVNHQIKYNTFSHVEEGLHYHQICSGCAKGSAVSVTNGLYVQYNYIVNWTRIGIEIQTANAGTAPMNVSHNLLINPINPSWKTMFISEACCTGGPTNGAANPANPPNTTYDNVLMADVAHTAIIPPFDAPVIGIEFWGAAGSFADWNWIGYQGANGITWGYNTSPIYARNNYLCAIIGGGYITDQQGSGPLTQVNNTTSATCVARVTMAPTITQTTSQVAISDVGMAGVPDGQPISIFYTTNGSTPTMASTLYTGPFTPTAGATVKAIGMWGVAPMPMAHLPGFGYTPSAVASAVFVGQTTTVTPPPVNPSTTLPFGNYNVVIGSGGITITKQ